MIKLRARVAILCLIISISILDIGCNAFTRTQQGASIGAGAGATVGGFIGKFAGNTALGAIIGGAVGGTAGAFIGRNIDKQAIDINKLTVPGATLTPQGEDVIVKFDSGIMFLPGATALDSAAKVNLKSLALSLRNCPQANVMIVGYADSKEGTPEYNMELSVKRADSVKVYIASAGIDSLRLNAKGKGQLNSIKSNSADYASAQNRRVDITLVLNEQSKNQASVGQTKN